MTQHLIDLLEEQSMVGFTGKLNILSNKNSQYLGHIEINEGVISSSYYNEKRGLKALYSVFVSENEGFSFKFVIEPEILNSNHKEIHYPFSVLKSKVAKVIEEYHKSKKLMPPKNLKLIIKPDFLSSGEVVSGQEYDLLLTLSDYNRVEDLYKNCKLLDYEITNALVSLRQKKALLVVQSN